MTKKLTFKNALSPLFIILAIIILYFGNFGQFLIYGVVVSIHELSHFFVAKKLGYKLGKLYIMPYGICLNYKESVIESNDEILIALSGPCANFLLCLLCVSLWWLFPITYYYLDYFCFCNLLLGAFNILPCFPLDGGRVFTAIFSKKFDKECVINITFIINYILSCLLFIAFIISAFNVINYSYIILSIFLFAGTIKPNKFSNYNYLSLVVNRNKILNRGTNVKLLAFNGNVPLFKIMAKFSKYKFNVVYVVLSSGGVKVFSENNINSFAAKYSPTNTINQIMFECNLNEFKKNLATSK